MPIREPHIAPESEPEPAQPPRRRADCQNVPRPCPWVRCRHHLLLEVTEGGGIALTAKQGSPGRSSTWPLHPLHPQPQVAERWCNRAVMRLEGMGETCALDVAERGPQTLHEIATILGVTRERVRQIETAALAKLRADDRFAAITSADADEPSIKECDEPLPRAIQGKMHLILLATAEHYGYTIGDLKDPRGRLRRVQAQAVAAFIAHTKFRVSHTEIGRLLGKHRTTVTHTVNRVQERLEAEPIFAGKVARIAEAVDALLAAQRADTAAA